jgi:hypothetical protein
MGQLTNLYVSESYQGLLKMTNSTTGVTGTLQTVQTGDGTNTPLQISQTQVNISGSLTVNGAPVTNVNTGSFVTTSSFNAYTSSMDTRVDGIEAKTGSYATTGSNTFIGAQTIQGNVTFPSNSFVSTDNVSGSLYLSSLNQGTLYLNADGGEGDVIVGYSAWQNSLKVKGGTTEITGSLGVTNIKGTGSLYLQPNQTDPRYLEVYNTSPTDTHITASGGQIFLGDDQTYVKVDNYGSVERIDIVAGNELVVSSSVINVSGSLHQSGTFYPDVIDWVSSSIVQSTGSYILTTNASGVTQYDSYANVAIALGQFSSSGTSGTSGTDGSSGTSGQDGSSGTSGTSGGTGSSGTSGTSGGTGSSGTSGTSGSNGSSGTSGASPFSLTGSIYNATTDLGVTGSVFVDGNLYNLSLNTTVQPSTYLTSSQAGQVNIIKGWSENPNAGGAGASQANYTGSLRITGSNNTVSLPQLRATGQGGGADQQGYISGSDNTIASNGSGIYLNTGSLLFPKTTNNYVGATSFISMNFTTSSLSGGHPIIQNNTLYAGGLTINSNSGSVQAVAGNLLNGGSITSTQNFVTNTRPSISTNIAGGLVTLNHISSSISYTTNINNAPVTINNAVSSSITNNNVSFGNNTFLGGQGGTGPSFFISGSQSSNLTRNFNSNLIGGNNIVVSSSFVSSSNSNLNSTLIYGNNLAVSASHTTGTLGGSAFFGRFNMTGSNLEDTQQVVFAVGTGTNAGLRKTGFLIDSGSTTRISGSLSVQGTESITGSLVVSGSLNAVIVSGSMDIRHYIAGQPALILNAQALGQPGLDVKGTTSMTGSLDISGSLRVTGNIQFASGSDTTMGTFVLNGANPGTATVSNSLVTANSLIFLTKQTNTNSGNGTVSVTSKGTGTFNVTSDHNGDADTVAYLIINPA